MFRKNLFHVTMFSRACISKNASKQWFHFKNFVANKDFKKI